MKKAVVIFSGGQDSTTCLGWALNRFDVVEAITFNYGQKHSVELECAAKICNEVGVKQTVIDISFLNTIVESALTSNGDVNQTNDKGLPASFVPNRNQLFITMAHAYAQKIGAQHLVTGVCQTDYSGYFDCRDVFVQEITRVSNLGSLGHSLTPAFIAGLAEGEGCFSRSYYKTKEGKQYYPVFSLEQADEGIIAELQAFFGAGNITERKSSRSELSQKKTWEFRLSYHDAQLIYNIMLNYGSATGRQKHKIKEWAEDHSKYLTEGNKGEITKQPGRLNIITTHTPLMYLDKAETFALAKKEEFLEAVIQDSHTCYNGNREIFHPWGFGCGECPACKLREKGYKEAIEKGLL